MEDGHNQGDEQSTPTQLAPGQSVSPRAAEPQQTEVAAPEQPAQPAATQEQMPAEPTQNFATQMTGQTYADGDAVNQADPGKDAADTGEPISWTASEFIAHHKTGSWYGLALLGTVVLAAAVWLLTRDWVSTSVVVIAGVVLIAYAGRQPGQQRYQLDRSGLTIGNKRYNFAQFRSFSIVPEGAFSSISFMPLKRFGLMTTIYYDPKDEEQIVDVISRHLPHEEHRQDALDHALRRIRF